MTVTSDNVDIIGPWPGSQGTEELKRTTIESARVLVVGAGGIGCELLKTLALSGFRNIHVIDLDTIDVSNLNRQFLFRKCHVGQSKASVAAEAIRAFQPNVHIEAEMADVTQAKYDVDFFRSFDLVLNGLDNLEARRHVNKMCLYARVPLVESGTAGYLGQVTVHKGSKVECFDCQPKPAQKSYAVCTIRRTPQKPIHCIVWAKEVALHGLFGEGDLEDIGGEELAYKRGEDVNTYAKKIFKKIFRDNIKDIVEDAAASKEDVWQGRDPPTPLPVEEFDNDIEYALRCESLDVKISDVLDIHENVKIFIKAVKDIVSKRGNEIGYITFDKDDDTMMRFVTAASNIRSHCYGIAPQSLFQAKGMAGNIIHAIATTNAIVAGLIVVQAMKILAAGKEVSHSNGVFVQQFPSNRKLVAPVRCLPPNPNCHACALVPLEVRLNTKEMTFKSFINDIIKAQWGFDSFMLDNGSGFMYEEDADLEPDEVKEYACHLPKTLSDLPGGGITHNTAITILDGGSSLKVPVLICHKDGAGYEVHGDLQAAKMVAARKDKEREYAEEKEKEAIVLEDGADGEFMIDLEDIQTGGVKRKREQG